MISLSKARRSRRVALDSLGSPLERRFLPSPGFIRDPSFLLKDQLDQNFNPLTPVYLVLADGNDVTLSNSFSKAYTAINATSPSWTINLEHEVDHSMTDDGSTIGVTVSHSHQDQAVVTAGTGGGPTSVYPSQEGDLDNRTSVSSNPSTLQWNFGLNDNNDHVLVMNFSIDISPQAVHFDRGGTLNFSSQFLTVSYDPSNGLSITPDASASFNGVPDGTNMTIDPNTNAITNPNFGTFSNFGGDNVNASYKVTVNAQNQNRTSELLSFQSAFYTSVDGGHGSPVGFGAGTTTANAMFNWSFSEHFIS